MVCYVDRVDLRLRLAAAWLLTSGAACESSTPTAGDDPGDAMCGPTKVGIDPFASYLGCAPLLAPVSAPPTVLARLVNHTDHDIVVANRTVGCHQPARHFELTGTLGGRAVVAPTDYCPCSWNACAARSPEWEGYKLCLTLHHPVLIVPGGTFEETWDAWVFAETTLPAACIDGDDDIQCNAATSMASGTFTAIAHAALVDTPECTCEVDEMGSCLVDSEKCQAPTSLTASAAYDGTCGSLEIVFTN